MAKQLFTEVLEGLPFPVPECFRPEKGPGGT
jgi:hypothetical protein